MILTSTDRRIVASLSGDLPESLTPFEEMASRFGVRQEEILRSIERLRRSGILRRFGATVDHRKIGFTANAMVAWRIPEENVEEAAEAVASSPAVSHCYLRESHPSWPYNLYAMIHSTARKECQEVAADLSRTIGCQEWKLLFSVREFKKTGPVYFGSTHGR